MYIKDMYQSLFCNRRHWGKIIGLLLVVSFVWPVWATPAASRSCLNMMTWGKMREGYRLRNIDTKKLAFGTGTLYAMTLFEDEDYYLFACGDKNVQDVTIYIYDQLGNLLQQDQDKSRQAILRFRPKKTATYRVVLGMVKGSGSYSFALLTKLGR